MYECVGGKHAWVDLTGVSALITLMTGGLTIGQPTLKAGPSMSTLIDNYTTLSM